MVRTPADSLAAGWLSEGDYAYVVRCAPLPAIDLVVHRRGEVLLGRRRNRPAAGWWFMPGGRVRKDERLAAAFERICESETTLAASFTAARFLGVVEHFYAENTRDDRSGTHCIALAYAVEAPSVSAAVMSAQHADSEWWTAERWSASPVVHPHVKETLQLAQQAGLLPSAFQARSPQR
jgi:colanic acid biosynthesis protein WcaH